MLKDEYHQLFDRVFQVFGSVYKKSTGSKRPAPIKRGNALYSDICEYQNLVYTLGSMANRIT